MNNLFSIELNYSNRYEKMKIITSIFTKRKSV